MKELIYESLVWPFVKRPIKHLCIFVLCLIGKRTLRNFLQIINEENHYGRVQFFKTLYINFMAMPMSVARHLPIFVYSNVEIISCGYIEFSSCKVYAGMVKFGRFDLRRSQGLSRFNNKGTIKIGGSGRALRGSEIFVWEGAKLQFGDNFFMGENTLVSCQNDIKIGKYFRLAYNSQIFDTDFHYSMQNETGIVRRKSKPVIIGDYNWIGNNCTIKKGTKTPNHTTVAGSYTVLTKDYTKEIPEYSILGGIPAKMLATGFSRLWNNELKRIAYLDKWFNENPSEKIYKYDMVNTDLNDLTENESI